MRKKIADQLIKYIFDRTHSFQKELPEIYNNLPETPLGLDFDQVEIPESVFETYCRLLRSELRFLEKEKMCEQTGWPQDLSNISYIRDFGFSASFVKGKRNIKT